MPRRRASCGFAATACTTCGTAPSPVGCCASICLPPAVSTARPADANARPRWRAAPGHRCSPIGSKRISSGSARRRSAPQSAAIVFTTPTCPSMPLRSTVMSRPAARWCTCTCRNMRHRRKLRSRTRGAGGARRSRRYRGCSRFPPNAFRSEAGSAVVHLHVQEYAPPKEIEIEDARRRRREALSTLPRLFAIPPERIHLRLRTRQSGAAQYQPVHAAGASPFTVEEAGLKFLVNLDDYLDTGLFLDHRLTRARLRERARAARFLTLFCYTASASVYAVAGGARSSLSIDLSNRYLEWAEQNYVLNGLDGAHHRLERADCREWLRAAAEAQFELIFLDPPTFSNSKRMQGVLDIQRDHLPLIERCMQRLAPGGPLGCASNAERVRLDEEVGRRWLVQDISAQTLPFDFARNPRIHRCFEIRALPACRSEERRVGTAWRSR